MPNAFEPNVSEPTEPVAEGRSVSQRRRPLARHSLRLVATPPQMRLALLVMLVLGAGTACDHRDANLPGPDESPAVEQVPVEQTPVEQALAASTQATSAQAEPTQAELAPWRSLFDGKTLAGWESTEFGGEGNVAVKESTITIDMGESLSGITSTLQDLPKIDYEISLEAMKVDGNDFFCGLTFPVEESHLTLILGGWGGATVGLSCINGFNASENESTTHYGFDNNHWYKIRLRVEKDRIQTWIDDHRVINVRTTDRELAIRDDVDLSKPLGIATWLTSSALRDIRLRKLTPDELSKPDGSDPQGKANESDQPGNP